MARIDLLQPVQLPTRFVRQIELREPGRRAVAAMADCRLPAGFTDAQTVRFGARLSGLTELTFRKLAPRDLAVVKAALENSYADARRRAAASKG